MWNGNCLIGLDRFRGRFKQITIALRQAKAPLCH